MAHSEPDRTPYPAVAALAVWAGENWSELEHDWLLAGLDRPSLLTLPTRRLFTFIYGAIMHRMPLEARDELRKKLTDTGDSDVTEPTPEGAPPRRRPRRVSEETQAIADQLGVPVPDWWDDNEAWDAPPEFRVSGDQ